jgi:hypothetical protein
VTSNGEVVGLEFQVETLKLQVESCKFSVSKNRFNMANTNGKGQTTGHFDVGH